VVSIKNLNIEHLVSTRTRQRFTLKVPENSIAKVLKGVILGLVQSKQTSLNLAKLKQNLHKHSNKLVQNSNKTQNELGRFEGPQIPQSLQK